MVQLSPGKNIVWMDAVGMNDVVRVGGKNASLGELLKSVAPKGVRIPKGFIVTADAYRSFIRETKLEHFITETLKGLDLKNFEDVSRRGRAIRDAIRKAKMPAELVREISVAYAEMEREYGKGVDVAVRSSGTAEDLPGASFAGQYETYLGIRGAKEVTKAVTQAFASLFTDRAISYRADKGFSQTEIALAVGVQKMVRSDKSASGIMFTVDPESGFRDVVVVNAVWGLGEMIVQGRVVPDEYLVSKSTLGSATKPIIGKTLGVKKKKMVYATAARAKRTKIVGVSRADEIRFALSDAEILTLARWGVLIEEHYTALAKKWTPMDMEWAKDGQTGELYIIQARPETVQVRRDLSKMTEYTLTKKGKELVRGASVGSRIATGIARRISSTKQITKFKKGEILVTTMTDPDWEPLMKLASAIVTDHGGRTSHAAIIARELGVPAIVGCGNATSVIEDGAPITVDTTGSEGVVYEGAGIITIHEHNIAKLPKTKTGIMASIASPDSAFGCSFLPVIGVGLAREEFIVASRIGVHPLAVINYSKLTPGVRSKIEKKMRGWIDPITYYIENLAFGIATVAAAFYPRPVIVRFSDFKTNEYASLLGGDEYEPKEVNPMIGWRGASRYYDSKFKKAFELECKAIARVRDEMGLTNVIPMIPFCRTIEEAKQTLSVMEDNRLKRGHNGLQVYLMCEIPSNILLADQFLDLFDGMSIGSNDLAQLTLGLDRDSGVVSHIGNENDPAVRDLISTVIKKCRVRGKHIGICGQGPSDLVGFVEFLVNENIESISLNPDAVIPTIMRVAKIEDKGSLQ